MITRPIATAALALLLASAGYTAQNETAPGDSAPAPLTLPAAVDLALKQSPTLEIARHELNVGLIDADRNRPAFRPEVSASASQVLRTPRVDLPGRPDELILPNSISRLEIGVKQPLLQFGVGKAPGQRANAMEAAARSEYRKAELDVALEAREAYLQILRVETLREIAVSGLDLARKNVALTRDLIVAGLQADVDLLEAQRSEAEAEAGLLQATNGASLARANLNRILGRSLDSPFGTTTPDGLPGDPGTREELTKRALEQRPEIAKLQHNLEAAEAGVQLAKSQRLPRVSLDATYALQTETVLTPRSGFAAGLSITAPLFNGVVNRFTVREAEERVKQLRQAIRAQEQGIELEIERQRLAMSEARSRRELADRAVASAEKAHEIKRLSLERGRTIQADVAAARLSLQRALADRAGAENDLRLARVRLDRALGE